jgi:hypothetical protein
MSQSKPQEGRFAKIVTELDLEIVVVGHGDQKIPNPKSQIPNKFPIPNFENRILLTKLEFITCDLFGVWSLGFGIFIRWVMGKRAGEAVPVRQEQVAGLVDLGRVRAGQRHLVERIRAG